MITPNVKEKVFIQQNDNIIDIIYPGNNVSVVFQPDNPFMSLSLQMITPNEKNMFSSVQNFIYLAWCHFWAENFSFFGHTRFVLGKFHHIIFYEIFIGKYNYSLTLSSVNFSGESKWQNFRVNNTVLDCPISSLPQCLSVTSHWYTPPPSLSTFTITCTTPPPFMTMPYFLIA